MWFLYILQCRDKSLYTGIAVDIEKRLKAHSTSRGSRYVRSKLPFKLVYQESHRTRSQALKRECQIKRLPRSKKLALIHQMRDYFLNRALENDIMRKD